MITEFYSEQISASVIWGGQVVLTPSWHDKHVAIPHNKIFYIIDGELEVSFGGKKIIGKAGDLLLIPSGIIHDYNLLKSGYAKKFWVHFDLHIGGKNFLDRFTLPEKIHVGLIPALNDAFTSVLLHAKSDKPSDNLLTISSLLSIISYFVEHSVYYEKHNNHDDIEHAIEYIKENYSQKFTLSELATNVNLSPNYFVKKFKERTGFSPMQYSVIVKLERAKFLIEQSNDPINAIMEELGFYDASHFSKLFKKYCGYSPKKFREISKRRFDILSKEQPSEN